MDDVILYYVMLRVVYVYVFSANIGYEVKETPLAPYMFVYRKFRQFKGKIKKEKCIDEKFSKSCW